MNGRTDGQRNICEQLRTTIFPVAVFSPGLDHVEFRKKTDSLSAQGR